MNLEKRREELEKIVYFLFENYKKENPTWDVIFESEEQRDELVRKALNNVFPEWRGESS